MGLIEQETFFFKATYKGYVGNVFYFLTKPWEARLRIPETLEEERLQGLTVMLQWPPRFNDRPSGTG